MFAKKVIYCVQQQILPSVAVSWLKTQISEEKGSLSKKSRQYAESCVGSFGFSQYFYHWG
jgi:hypothetical protein